MNTAKKESASDFWNRYYGDFVGTKILSFNGMKENEDGFGDGFPTFTVQFKDGTFGEIEISQDPEGNGGGFIFGLSY
jgi:hypothetical protein